MNKEKSVKWWIKNISMSEANATELRYFDLWKEKCRQCVVRQIIKEPVA